MKIAVIGAKGLPPKQGGIEHYCAEVYPRMVEQGHSVDLFARSSYTKLPPLARYEFKGVKVTTLPCPGIRGIDAFVSSALGAIPSIGNQYDIVHFHALGPALFTWVPRLFSSAKVVVTCQGLDWQRDKWGKISSGLIFQGERAAVQFSHGLIVVSEDLRSYFLKSYKKESVYIPNAPASYADSDPTFSYGKSLGLTSGKYIVYLGRLVPEKRPDLLIRAFQKLKANDWKLVFVGGNSDTPSYTAELLNLSADNSNIVFAGEQRGSHLAELVRGAGLFVLPSYLEGLPLAMLEAMLENVPVLASDIPPHQQLIGNDRGLLFRAGDVESCSQSIDWAIQHPHEMRQMAEKAQNYTRLNYTWEQITAQNLQLYSRLLDPSKNYQSSLKTEA